MTRPHDDYWLKKFRADVRREPPTHVVKGAWMFALPTQVYGMKPYRPRSVAAGDQVTDRPVVTSWPPRYVIVVPPSEPKVRWPDCTLCGREFVMYHLDDRVWALARFNGMLCVPCFRTVVQARNVVIP
jgi:hypothetical protein